MAHEPLPIGYLTCEKCGHEFQLLLKMFDPQDRSPIMVCSGACSSEITLYNKTVCKNCNKGSMYEYKGDEITDEFDFLLCYGCKNWL